MNTDLGDLVKQFAWDPWINALLAMFFGYIPWLAWPPMRQILTLIIKQFTDLIYDETHESVDILAMTLRTNAQKRAYSEKTVTLKIIARDKGANSEEFKYARKEASQALSDLVRFDSAAD